MRDELLKIVNAEPGSGGWVGNVDLYEKYYKKYENNLLMSLYFKHLNITSAALVYVKSDALLKLLENE